MKYNDARTAIISFFVDLRKDPLHAIGVILIIFVFTLAGSVLVGFGNRFGSRFGFDNDSSLSTGTGTLFISATDGSVALGGDNYGTITTNFTEAKFPPPNVTYKILSPSKWRDDHFETTFLIAVSYFIGAIDLEIVGSNVNVSPIVERVQYGSYDEGPRLLSCYNVDKRTIRLESLMGTNTHTLSFEETCSSYQPITEGDVVFLWEE